MQNLVQTLIRQGIEEGCFPCAAAAVGCRQEIFAQYVDGQAFLPSGPRANLDTRYDMASCTKILAATPLALLAVEQGL